MLIFITFCIIVLIQFYFYLFLFGKFSFLNPLRKDYGTNLISVIICAKNEDDNLKQNLVLIAKQDYPEFEIVLVDDASTDHTLKIMQEFKAQFDSNKLSIQIISISDKNTKGKKAALSIGIKAAKYERLLLTDADCKPISKHWISEMASSIHKGKTIVLGYGAYKKIHNSFINKLIRFETLLTAIQYFSYAKIGKPYMGVGRNIAYKKDEFKKVNGFTKHYHLISGDDDLFINEIADKENTEICFSKNSFTISEPETNFNSWIKQKRRHITTANQYKSFHKFLLSLFYFSQIFFWILATYLLLFNINSTITLILVCFRLTFWYIVIIKSAHKLDEKDLVRLAPIYEISIIFIQLYIFTRNIISSPKQW